MDKNELNPGAAVKILLSQPVFIVWNPDYNLGIPIIDEHHRGIVTTINSLHFGMQNNNIKEILFPIIDMVYDYTLIHFQIEEDFLVKFGFPNVERHHELHEELTTRLKKIGRKSLLDNDPYDFMNFLKTWWINHICFEDLLFKDYFF